MYPCITCILWYKPLYILVYCHYYSGNLVLRYTQVCLVYSGTYLSSACIILYSLVHCHVPLYHLVYSGTSLYIFLYTITITLVHPWYSGTPRYTQVCLVYSGIYVSYSCTILVFSCTLFMFCHVTFTLDKKIKR